MESPYILVVDGTTMLGNPFLGSTRILVGVDHQQLMAITGDGMGLRCGVGHMHGRTELGFVTYGKELGDGVRLVIDLSGTDPAAALHIGLLFGTRAQLVRCPNWVYMHSVEMFMQLTLEQRLEALRKMREDILSAGELGLIGDPVSFLRRMQEDGDVNGDDDAGGVEFSNVDELLAVVGFKHDLDDDGWALHD